MSVLVIKQGALGDVIMATALIDAIVRGHPESSVCLLTTPPFAGLFAAWPGLEVVSFPRKGWRAVASTLRWMRARRFRRVYDLQGNDRTALLCALSGIPERVGSHTHFPYNLHPATRWDAQSHVFLRLNAVLDAAGIAPAAPRPRLPCAAAARDEVEAFMQTHALPRGGFVVMHAGASRTRQDKCWPGFEALAQTLQAAGLAIVWLGGSDDRERNAALAAKLGIDATDCFSIPQLAALASHARFAVTNDSGPMHACAAAGVPVFALFGPSDWRRNHALGQGENVIAGVELLPDLYGLRTSDCLARITPEHVLTMIRARGLLG